MTIELPLKVEGLFRPKRYKVRFGGRGSAKSWSIARALIMLALNPEMLFPDRTKIRILCARELQNSIKESVHQLLRDQIDALDLAAHFTVTDNSIVSENGSEFIFSGIKNNVTKIKSMEGIDIVWVEEAEKVSHNSWQVLIPTVRRPGSEIWVTFNPDDEKDSTYQRFVVKPPPNLDIEMMNWMDNPFLPLELIEEKDYLYSVDPEAAEHVWGGACNTRSDAVIFRDKYVLEEFIPNEPNTGQWFGPYFGADWGFATDPTVLTKLWININKNAPEGKRNRLLIEKESWGLHVENNKIAPNWVRDIPECVGHVIRADSSRPETISHVSNFPIGRHFLNVQAAKKWPGSVEDGISYFRGFEQIVIHPRCEHHALEARLYKYKVDRITKDVLREIVDKHNHCWDAARYAMEPAISTEMEMRLEHQEEVHITSELDTVDLSSIGGVDGFQVSNW